MLLETLKYYICVDGSVVCCYNIDYSDSERPEAWCVDINENYILAYNIDGSHDGMSRATSESYRIVKEYIPKK